MKETMDVLNAVEAECDALIKSCEDGKITVLDLRHQLPVIGKARDAFVNAAAVPGEIKGASEEQMTALYDKVVAVGAKVVEAFAAVSAVLSKAA